MTLPDHPDGIYNPAIFGYARASQAESEDGGLETQRRLLNEQGIRNDRIFSDVASGRNLARPGWERLRSVVRPGDTIIATRLDRVALSLGEGVRAIAELHNEGIGLRTIAEGLDTGDDSQAHLFLVLAELVPRAAAEGRHPGRPPVLTPEQAQAICDLMAINNGNISATARTFDTSRRTVHRIRDGTHAALRGPGDSPGEASMPL